jgi:hypothetical protein
MKKSYITIFIICCLLLISRPISADVKYFCDLTGHWGECNVYYVSDFGLINGYPDATFCPNNSITRSEFLVILALDSGEDLSAYMNDNTFNDVIPDFWGKKYINWGATNGIVNGYDDGSFHPNSIISRQEMATILYRYIVTYQGLTLPEVNAEIQFTDQFSIGSWALSSVKAIQKAGIINGYSDRSFSPLSGATRAESATMVANYLKIYHPETATPLLTTDLYSNGTLIKSNMTLINQNGVLLIAARTFLEAAGFRVTYFGAPKLIVADDIGHDLEFWIGKTTYYANGTKKTFSAAPQIIGETTYVPLYETAAATGYSAIIHNTGTGSQYLALTYQDSFLTRNTNHFYGTATSASNVNGNVFFANSDNTSGFFGKLINGAMSYGSYTTSDGDLYFGNWNNGVMNGAGRYIKADGEFFVGTFSSGAKYTGMTYYLNGATFNGTWTKSSSGAIYPSKGTYVDKDGKVFGSDSTTWNNGAITIK